MKNSNQQAHQNNDKINKNFNFQKIERKHLSLVEVDGGKTILNDQELEEFLESKRESTIQSINRSPNKDKTIWATFGNCQQNPQSTDHIQNMADKAIDSKSIKQELKSENLSNLPEIEVKTLHDQLWEKLTQNDSKILQNEMQNQRNENLISSISNQRLWINNNTTADKRSIKNVINIYSI